jgi:hypothetical protein
MGCPPQRGPGGVPGDGEQPFRPVEIRPPCQQHMPSPVISAVGTDIAGDNPLYHPVNVGARRYHPGHAR